MADFDLRRLEKELETAADEEEKYYRIDEVKKKAITTTASYEEFRQRVLAVDLKPVSSKEFEGAFHRKKGDLVAKNRGITLIDHGRDNARGRTRKTTGVRAFAADDVPQQAPKHVMEFSREWRRKCKTTQARYQYLRLFTPKRVSKVFKNDLESVVFGQIVGALAAHLPAPPNGDGSAGGDVARTSIDVSNGGNDDAGAGSGGGGGANGASTNADSDAGAGAGAGVSGSVGDDGGNSGGDEVQHGEAGDKQATGSSTKSGSSKKKKAPSDRSVAAWCLRILDAFTNVSRFGLMMKLLGDEDRACLQQVLQRLKAWGGRPVRKGEGGKKLTVAAVEAVATTFSEAHA